MPQRAARGSSALGGGWRPLRALRWPGALGGGARQSGCAASTGGQSGFSHANRHGLRGVQIGGLRIRAREFARTGADLQ
eukprot:7813440-Alexandrium_andersonii.AAC.1